MANWDHKSNIGLHPCLDPDPLVRIPAQIEAQNARIARAEAEKAKLEAQLAEVRRQIPLTPGYYRVPGFGLGVEDSDPLALPIKMLSEQTEEWAATFAENVTEERWVVFEVTEDDEQ